MKIRLTRRILALALAFIMVVGLMPFTAEARSAQMPTISPLAADDATWDIPLTELQVSCGDYERNGGANEGPAHLAVDNNTATMWHTDWYGTSRANHWFQFEQLGEYAVNGLRYLPRQTGNSNGTITQYEIRVSDDGVNFTTVAEGTWAANSSWKIAEFEPQSAKYIRLVSLAAESDVSYVLASAAELRLTYQPTAVSDADKTALDALIAECELIERGNYTGKSWQRFQNALEDARAVSANAYASQAQVDAALAALAAAKDGLQESTGEGPHKILHLDNGRKMFSKDWIIALMTEMKAAGYTHLQLAFGNNGLRFLLDDMTIETDAATYNSDAIKEGVKNGNAAYYDEGEKHALTEAEMDEILAHGQAIGLGVIPHLNMPGHMNAVLAAMDNVGIADSHFKGYTTSASSVNLNNEEALDFMAALVDKYAAYFSAKGCKYFHIGADEYANDAYYGSMGFPSMGAAMYQKFADFVNNNATIVKSHGMTPIAWNDGIRYGSYTAQFDSDIVIDYWSSGWSGYTLAKASTLDTLGHGLINTNGDFYYILGKNDRFTPGNTSAHDPNLYTECAGYDLNRFMDGSTIEYPVGGMFCIWSDYPGAETEQQVAQNIRLVLRAMALRMDGLDLDGMNTDVVPGGFNEDGSINISHEHTAAEAVVENVVEATCFTDGSYDSVVYCSECGEVISRETIIVPALNHANTVVRDAVEATCTEDGYSGDTWCLDCGRRLSVGEVIPATGHEWEDGSCVHCGEQFEMPFVDVPVDSWYAAPVLWAVEQGITSGVDENHFAPNAVCTRAQVVTFLWSAAGKPDFVSAENPFSDVHEGDYYYNAVLWAVEQGITSGVDAEHFAPHAECTRAQVITFLWHANGDPASEAEVAFDDVQSGSYYYNAVKWAVENGVTSGISATQFGVGSPCTRAQVVTFLYSAFAE